jgi:hypothetical protein
MEGVEYRDKWIESFRHEYCLRAGYEFTELSPADLFYQFYGDTPHEAVCWWMNEYGLTDLTAGQTIYYVVEDDEGAFLVENDPGDDRVFWCGTNKFDAEVWLCKCCEGYD